MEMVHTYSLIHDDLPAMDDDDLRRGRPSCHRDFDEATAILAGDALLTQAFLVLAAGPPAGLPAEQRARAAALLAAGRGHGGDDRRADGRPGGRGRAGEPAVVERIHLLKTGALITASLLIGATLAGAGEEELGRMRAYGRRLGLLFQITDDILDVTGDPALLGKSAGKDDRQQKATWPAAVGLEEARAAAARLAAEAREALAPCGPRGGDPAPTGRLPAPAPPLTGAIHGPAERGGTMPPRERLDRLLVLRGLAESGARARALILAGEVTVDGRPADKPGTAVDAGARDRAAGAGRGRPLRQPRRAEAGGGAPPLGHRLRRPGGPRPRRLHRRLHRLPAPARLPAGHRRRRRPRAPRLAAAPGPAGRAPRAAQRPLPPGGAAPRAARPGDRRPLLHLPGKGPPAGL